MDYTAHVSTKKTPQTEKIPGRKGMVKNHAGGYVFTVSDQSRLDRFLILGTAGGTYYASEAKLTKEAAHDIIEMIRKDGMFVLNRTVEVSDQGLAPKNDPAIFVLALVCAFGAPLVQQAAYKQITKVCRTGTHLFTFAQAIKGLRKWSRGLRNGVSRFYEARPADKLALQLLKYRSRKVGDQTWTHADVVRLAHPQFPVGAEGLAYRLFGKEAPKEKPVPEIWKAFEEIQTFKEKKDIKKAIRLIEEHKLPWEAVPTELHGFAEIWEAFLPHMGYTALLRNLSRFAKLGIISEHGFDGNTKFIGEQFANVEALKESRLHPLTILNGMKAYSLGHSVHRYGQEADKWKVSQRVVDILDSAFYAGFKNVEPTGHNYLFALDVSGSMCSPISSRMAISCREGSTALALVSMNVEPETFLMGFSTRFMELKITKKSRLQDACAYTEGLPFEGTDCSKPMTWATKNKVPVDVFCVYTDSETYAGSSHPTQALEQYRQVMGRDAKMVVVGMTSTGFTIADPLDPRQLDVVGFSTDTPQAIAAFVGKAEVKPQTA